MKKIISNSLEHTLAIGAKIARKLAAGDILCLFGNFGSGKTQLVKGIARGLNLCQEQVNSPSFVLLKQYKGKLILNHFDLYRLKKLKDILDIGLENYIYSDAISVIEWAQRLGNYLPQQFLGIKLAIISKDKRRLDFFAHGPYYNKLIKNLKF